MKNILYKLFYDIIEEMVEEKIHNSVDSKLSDMYIVKILNEEIIKIQPNIEEKMKRFFIDKIQDGEFPKENAEYWSCMFCGHIDKIDCKYCSKCGAKW